MKLLHTSDWHIGRALGHRNRYREYEAFLNWLAGFTYPKDVSIPTPDEIWQPRKNILEPPSKDQCCPLDFGLNRLAQKVKGARYYQVPLFAEHYGYCEDNWYYVPRITRPDHRDAPMEKTSMNTNNR